MNVDRKKRHYIFLLLIHYLSHVYLQQIRYELKNKIKLQDELT